MGSTYGKPGPPLRGIFVFASDGLADTFVPAGQAYASPVSSWLSFLLALPFLAFALWLKARTGRNGTNAELWGAPSDQELIEAGLPPRDPNSYHAKNEPRLFGPFPEDQE
jgi:hypothetical protein